MSKNLLKGLRLSRSLSFIVISTVLVTIVTSCEEEAAVKIPVITSFSPDKGLPGTIVTIIGENFNATPTENTVTISGIATTVTGATATSLTVTVPEGVSTGKIQVIVNGHVVTSSGDFIVPPVIASFAPTSAIAGSSVVITGTGFSSTASGNQVTFNGKTATVTQASATSLTVTVPADGTSGKIAVNVGGESTNSAQDFIYVPVITGFSSVHGSINSEVTITGSGFSLPASSNQVLFNGASAEIISGTTTSLVVKVPSNATTGPISIISGENSVVGNSFEIVIEAMRMAGSGYESGNALAIDGANNTYVTGSFQGTITIGNTSLVAQGGTNIFVVKYNAKGELVWAKSVGGTGFSYGYGIVIDNAGNSYITGEFSNTAVFGSFTISSTGGSIDPFVAKLNAAGDFQWVKSFGSPDTDKGNEIILDHEQNLVVVGQFFQTITIGATSMTSLGGSDIFVAKFNKDSGNPIWAKRFGGVESNGSIGLSYNNADDLYVGGSFFGTIELNGNTFTAGGTTLNSFVLKLNSSGEFVWAKEIDGTGWNNIYGITTDLQGNCIVTGYFTNSATIGATVLNATGNEDVLLAKFAVADGSLLWAKREGGASYDQGSSIARDAAGNFYITGYFERSASFGDKNVTSSGNSRDIFVAKYTTDGTLQWIKTAGGAETDSGKSIAVSSTGVVCTTGFYRDFAVTFGATVLENAGGDDAFLWKIWQD